MTETTIFVLGPIPILKPKLADTNEIEIIFRAVLLTNQSEKRKSTALVKFVPRELCGRLVC